MSNASRKFFAVATALVVLAANLTCVCRTAAANHRQAGRPDATGRGPGGHACCKHKGGGAPAPARDDNSDPHGHDGACPHCGGSAVTSRATVGAADVAGAVPDGLALPTPAALHSPIRVDRDPVNFALETGPPGLAAAGTLLGLHCALNL